MRAIAILALSAAAFAAERDTCPAWSVYEISATARGAYSNAYVEADSILRAQFRGPGGEKLVTYGFWDGGNNWKVRFAPPAAGRWTYETVSRDPGLNGLRGACEATGWTEEEKTANRTRRGFIHVARTGRYFEHADGTPFLWIGDTWWAWAKKGIPFERFRRLVDDRAAMGFTIGQMFVSGRSWLLDDAREIPDFEQIRKVEQFIEYANSKGLTVWVHPWWSGKDLGKEVGPEKIRRWWRYVIHRFGAYNVAWVLAGEYNMDNYGGLGLRFWKDLGEMVREEDPYRRITGAHPTPPGWQGGADAPQWSTGEVLHRERWLGYNQIQTGHARWRNEMIPSLIAADYARRPAKPVVVTEPWYEFVRGNPPPEDVRFAAWSAILSGAAGHTYGGGHVWWAHVPEAPADVGPWPIEPLEADTLEYPGAVSISFLAHFLEGLRWWRLEPHPELVLDNPSRFCGAIPGQEYVVYLRWGGAVKLDLRRAAGEFAYAWIDLTEGRERSRGTVAGGAAREFHAPEDYPRFPQYKDWLLHVQRAAGKAGSPQRTQRTQR